MDKTKNYYLTVDYRSVDTETITGLVPDVDSDDGVEEISSQETDRISESESISSKKQIQDQDLRLVSAYFKEGLAAVGETA